MSDYDPETGVILPMDLEFSAEKGEIFAAIAAAQGAMEETGKTGKNPRFGKFSNLTDVVQAIREPLATEGVAVLQFPGGKDGKLTIVTLLGHSSGQWIKGTLPTGTNLGPNPQDVGSAITYYRRYCLSAILDVVAGAAVDDDGNALADKAVQQESENPAPQAQTPPKGKGGTRQASPETKGRAISDDLRGRTEAIKAALQKAPTAKAIDEIIKAQGKTLSELKAASPTAYEFLMTASQQAKDLLASSAEPMLHERLGA